VLRQGKGKGTQGQWPGQGRIRQGKGRALESQAVQGKETQGIKKPWQGARVSMTET